MAVPKRMMSRLNTRILNTAPRSWSRRDPGMHVGVSKPDATIASGIDQGWRAGRVEFGGVVGLRQPHHRRCAFPHRQLHEKTVSPADRLARVLSSPSWSFVVEPRQAGATARTVAAVGHRFTR